MHTTIKNIILASIDTKRQVMENPVLVARVAESVDMLVTAFKNGNKVLFCGNGGSAADAQHLAAEFSGKFYLDRDALPAEALHVNSSYITAVANDHSFDVVYSRMIKGIGRKGDVLIGLSTSGTSVNIIKAFEMAKIKEMHCIALTGQTGGNLQPLADILLNVPSTDTARIQEAHILLGHIICQLVEAQYFGSNSL